MAIILPAGEDVDLRSTLEDEDSLQSFTYSLVTALVEGGVLEEEGEGQLQVDRDSLSLEVLPVTIDQVLPDADGGEDGGEAGANAARA
jgi:hypothetical protein